MNSAFFTTRFRANMPGGGWPERFAVVTACNPQGRTLSPEENRIRTDALRKALEQKMVQCFPVTGGSPDFTHLEEGFGLVGLSLAQALGWGRSWDQLAIFWVEEGTVYLASCGEPNAPLDALGRWSSRLESM